MSFNRHTGTGLEGKIMGYAPQGATPYAYGQDCDSRTILRNGDIVTVISVWDREHYLPGAVLLAYIHSHSTGECTHVPVTDLHDIV